MSEGRLNSSLEQLLKYPSVQWFFSYTNMSGVTLPIDVHPFWSPVTIGQLWIPAAGVIYTYYFLLTVLRKMEEKPVPLFQHNTHKYIHVFHKDISVK